MSEIEWFMLGATTGFAVAVATSLVTLFLAQWAIRKQIAAFWHHSPTPVVAAVDTNGEKR